MTKISYSMYMTIILLLLSLLVPSSLGMIKDISGIRLEDSNSDILSSYVYSLDDTPEGSEVPYIKADISITREKFSDYGFVQIAIYNGSCTSVGVLREKEVYYCCSEQLYNEGGCLDSRPGEIIYALDDISKGCLFIQKIEFDADEEEAGLTVQMDISVSDEYYVHIANCNSEKNQKGSILLDGSVTWKNPYGYLPGDVFMHLRVSLAFAILHFIVFVVFLVLCIIYRKLLLSIQYALLAVLLYCIMEALSWYIYRIVLNTTGGYSVPALCFEVFLANLKKTSLRVLLLLICMGLGTVKWTLGTTRMKIAYLAGFYMFFSFFLQIIKEVESLGKRKFEQWLIFLIVIPAAALDTCFYYWIVLSLIRTTQQLTLRKQEMKLRVFKAFFVVLIISGITALIMILYTGYLRWSSKSIDWKSAWKLDLFWDGLFFFVLSAVAFLWRPRHNNARYGYAEFFTEDDADENQVPLETISVRPKKREKDGQFFEEAIMSIDLPTEDKDEIDLDTEQKKID